MLSTYPWVSSHLRGTHTQVTNLKGTWGSCLVLMSHQISPRYWQYAQYYPSPEIDVCMFKLYLIARLLWEASSWTISGAMMMRRPVMLLIDQGPEWCVWAIQYHTRVCKKFCRSCKAQPDIWQILSESSKLLRYHREHQCYCWVLPSWLPGITQTYDDHSLVGPKSNRLVYWIIW